MIVLALLNLPLHRHTLTPFALALLIISNTAGAVRFMASILCLAGEWRVINDPEGEDVTVRR